MGNRISIGAAYKDQDLDGSTIVNAAISASTVAATTLSSSGQTTLGDAAADLIAFHGATPVDQADAITTMVTAVFSAAYTGMWAYSSSTAAKLVVTRINSILACLREKGLIAT